MKRLLLVTMGTASFLLSSAQVPIDEAHFPDDFFRDYVSQHFDADEDVQLDDEDGGGGNHDGEHDGDDSGGCPNGFDHKVFQQMHFVERFGVFRLFAGFGVGDKWTLERIGRECQCKP